MTFLHEKTSNLSTESNIINLVHQQGNPVVATPDVPSSSNNSHSNDPETPWTKRQKGMLTDSCSRPVASLKLLGEGDLFTHLRVSSRAPHGGARGEHF